MTNPYQQLPEKAFWRSAVADRSLFAIDGLWDPKFHLRPVHKVATFGSCFAQHIGRALGSRGYTWLNTEPAPYGLSSESARRFGYDVFTCRTGNIYTTSLLLQWLRWSVENQDPPAEFWEKDGRVYDPFRPQIEPDGFASVEEMRASRAATIAAFREAVATCRVFVFTLGLTESWFNRDKGYEYPLCPGTAAGEFAADRHVFRNQRFGVIRDRLVAALELIRRVNPTVRVILTVSPVPLTATNSGKHVLVATMASKSILRAVAAEVAEKPFVDYFPSYEIINAPPFRGAFFEANQRSVAEHGVNFVMDSFFRCLHGKFGEPLLRRTRPEPAASVQDPVCEEELLAAFGGKR